MRASPLHHFPLYATQDPEVSRRIMADHGVTGYDVVGEATNYDQHVNAISLNSLSMYYGSCSAGVRMNFSAVGSIRQRVCFAGAGRSTSGNVISELDPRKWSGVIPAGEAGSFDFGAGYEELRLVVDDEVIKRKIGALIGDAPVDQVVFERSDDMRARNLAGFRRALAFLLSELDAGGPQAPGAVVNELAEVLLVSYLCGQEHNFTHRLVRRDQRPSSLQQRLAEDYIAAHWNEPLTVEEIAHATGVSVRSIFRSFQDTRGCSPFQYVKRVRLERARAMLLQQEGHVSVISVALKCGFQSLGHFAKGYREAYGELPSATVRR